MQINVGLLLEHRQAFFRNQDTIISQEGAAFLCRAGVDLAVLDLIQFEVDTNFITSTASLGIFVCCNRPGKTAYFNPLLRAVSKNIRYGGRK